MSARGEGPYALLAHTPALADSFRQLGQYFRDGVDVPPALRELAILGTARSWSGDYVWNAHFARAQELLSPDVVKGLAQEAVRKRPMKPRHLSCGCV